MEKWKKRAINSETITHLNFAESEEEMLSFIHRCHNVKYKPLICLGLSVSFIQ